MAHGDRCQGGASAPLVSPLIHWLPWLEERRCGVRAFSSVIPYGTVQARYGRMPARRRIDQAHSEPRTERHDG